MATLIKIFEILFTLYASTFLIRFIAQWVRADHRNQIAQAIMQITNPMVLPLRRFIPSISGKDTASLVCFMLVITLGTMLVSFMMHNTSLIVISVMALYRMFAAILDLYFFLLLLSAILSWVNPNPYNPVGQFINALVDPILKPLRRFIPPIGGTIDITPLIAMLIIFFFQNESPRWFAMLLKSLVGA